MTFLYIKHGCPGCDKAMELLDSQSEAYKAVPVDNPALEVGIQTLLKKNFVLVPLLVRTSGRAAEVFVPAKGEDGALSFIRTV